MLDITSCPVCGLDVESPSDFFTEIYSISCKRCGDYSITRQAEKNNLIDENRKHILSGAIRELYEKGNQVKLTSDNIKDFETWVSVPDGPIEAIDKILLCIHRYHKAKTDSTCIEFTPNLDYPIAYAKDSNDFRYYLEIAEDRLGYIEKGDRGQPFYDYLLSIDGWERVNELKKIKLESNQAFVAMWFDKKVDKAWSDGFYDALKDVGYKPIRIDQTQFNGKICDRIIAEIRKSGLLIADFTGDRGGVYFEAGFAMGLGIPVIWTCRHDYVKGLHFDTRQYNHIIWEKPEDLKEQLVARIEATIFNR